MGQDDSEHGEPQGSSSLPHSFPPASLWPVVFGGVIAILGLSLFWAANEDNQDATIPVVAGAAALVVTTAVAWAFEQGAFGRQMKGERAGESLAARHTQVITFAIAEGQLDGARGEDGILAVLDNAAGDLRSHAGFDDLRVSVSPADSGPSQALAETVWASRQEFAGYDRAKDTILDLITQAGDQVVPGSVQAFDMDVVRDTKEAPVRFTLLHGAALLTALVVGGFAVGIVAAAVDDNGGGSAVAAEPDGDPFLVTATDNAFDRSTLSATPETEVTFEFNNTGAVLHNLAFYDSKGGAPLTETSIGAFTDGGDEDAVVFTTPGAGEYYYQCDLHPTEMFGTFTVE